MTPRRFLALALFVPVFLLVQAIHRIGLLLDELLYPGYRDVTVREPLFVVGLPRSGTSFLQEVLARDRERFTTLRLRELLLAPSITERKLMHGLGTLDRAVGRPFGRMLSAVERRAGEWMDEIHPISLDAPEEDHLLLLPIFACFLLVVPFPHSRRVWKLSRFDELPAEEREPILGFYRSCVQRHLYLAGPEKALLSKNPSFTPFVRSLVDAFPDARLVCCVRDPTRAVPSLLSSLRPGSRIFGWDPADPAYRDRFLDMLERHARHALTVLPDLPDDRHAFVPLRELREDARRVVLRIYERFGWSAGPDFRRQLDEARVRGRSHESRHRYTLEEFGLSEDGVRSRFSGLTRRFGYGPESSTDGPRTEPRARGGASRRSSPSPASDDPES